MTLLSEVTPGAVLMVAGQVYAKDPDRWEDFEHRPEYHRLAQFAWSLAAAVMDEKERRQKVELAALKEKQKGGTIITGEVFP